MISCAYRAFFETVNSESTVCGPSEDYLDLVQFKECTRDVKAQPSEKKEDVQVLVSVFFLSYSDTDPKRLTTFSGKKIYP